MHDFFHFLILFGALQGLLIGVLLVCRRPVRQQYWLLAALLWLLAMCAFNAMSISAPWLNSARWLDVLAQVLPLVVFMPVGPLLFFYVRSLMEPDFRLTYKDSRHFYPVALDLFPYTVAALVNLGLMKRGTAGAIIEFCEIYTDGLRWLSLSIYLVMTVRYLMQYHGRLDRVYLPLWKWAHEVTILFCCLLGIWLFFLVPYLIPATRDSLLNRTGWYPIFVPVTILIYWLGIKGYLWSFRQIPVISPKANSIAEENISSTCLALQRAMEVQELYLEPGLTLTSLAGVTGIPAKTISAVLNQHLQTNFNEYVNNYRVEAFKKKVLQTDLQQYTLSSIAFSCGFSSQATFQRVFKQLTGMAPGQFLQMQSCSGS
ncbi:helix-turn-helix domain-containing protein [Chitinophaga solisilvae]|uniref:helix-turn-helix domain-containing protein n=1 Tax=Chitinophaga solisilvae TaxID=1233460 RepID=UPI00136B1E96|nr:helix-turn-helix transcriptional regulator [Chitinophaga solisilvae]